MSERVGNIEDAHPGQSGFRLLSDGSEAFVVRMQSARLAARSLDVQTYIWHADLTGAYLGAGPARGGRPRRPGPAPAGRPRRAREERRPRGAGGASEHRSAHVQPLGHAQGHAGEGGRGRPQLQAHQPADAQQELDRRQPDRGRGRAQRRRRVLRRRRRNQFRGPRLRDAGPDRPRRVGHLRPVLELDLRVPDGDPGPGRCERRRAGEAAQARSRGARPKRRRAAMRSPCAATTACSADARGRVARASGHRSTSSCRTTRPRSR